VPASVMHSFRAAHNAVHWKIVVHGELTPSRAFQRAFTIVVRPRRATANDGVPTT
jgi:hypothetical protein